MFLYMAKYEHYIYINDLIAFWKDTYIFHHTKILLKDQNIDLPIF